MLTRLQCCLAGVPLLENDDAYVMWLYSYDDRFRQYYVVQSIVDAHLDEYCASFNIDECSKVIRELFKFEPFVGTANDARKMVGGRCFPVILHKGFADQIIEESLDYAESYFDEAFTVLCDVYNKAPFKTSPSIATPSKTATAEQREALANALKEVENSLNSSFGYTMFSSLNRAKLDMRDRLSIDRWMSTFAAYYWVTTALPDSDEPHYRYAFPDEKTALPSKEVWLKFFASRELVLYMAKNGLHQPYSTVRNDRDLKALKKEMSRKKKLLMNQIDKHKEPSPLFNF